MYRSCVEDGMPTRQATKGIVFVEKVATKPHIGSVLELKWNFEKEGAYAEAVGYCSVCSHPFPY